MDISSLIGLCLAVGLILASMLLGTAPMAAFLDAPSMLVVLGGAAAATLMCFPLHTVLSLPQIIRKVFLNKSEDVIELIEQMVSLAETARRDGLLALEGRMQEVNNRFVRIGIQMAVDGTRPEVIEDIMRTEVSIIAARHRDGKSMMEQMGRFAPAYGMIGTLMGLIMMLSDMTDPSGIGKGMAVALITTLYGAIVANTVCMPFAEKLSFINKQELCSLEIVIRGVMAIQSGENPRVIEQKLSTYLPPKLRAQREAA